MVAILASGVLRAQTVEARDTITLTSGKEVKGRVIRMDGDELVLRVGSRDRTFERADVRKVHSVAASHKQLMTAWSAASADNVDDLLAIAGHADDVGLPHEARLMRWYALLQRPGDEALHTALGNKKRGKQFVVEIDGRWVPLAEADALGENFSKAWQLRSEHFLVRCAAGLRVGLDTLMECERLYWTMHDLFGKELKLQEIVEPMEVRIYRDRKQMPSISSLAGAYFNPGDPALYSCYENGRPFALIHEATHELQHFFFVRAAKSRGQLPGWLDEGWAEYMGGRVLTRQPGKPNVLDKSVIAGHVRLLRQARADKDLYGLHRVLNFKAGDFQASTKQGVKYAQSWALFRYLFEHRDPQIRTLFFDFLREAAGGKGQASTFRKLFKKHYKQIEAEAWQ